MVGPPVGQLLVLLWVRISTRLMWSKPVLFFRDSSHSFNFFSDVLATELFSRTNELYWITVRMLDDFLCNFKRQVLLSRRMSHPVAIELIR